MNYRMVFRVVGRVLSIEAILLLLPLFTAIIYDEPVGCFVLTIAITAIIGLLFTGRKPQNDLIYEAEGFVSVGLSWIAMSVCGSLPFIFSGFIPNIADALFETVSGFTTTGASILTDIEALPNSLLFWRSFTHWIGGMGVLVFVMAVMPLSEERSMHIMRAEIPGPTVGKLVPRMRHTATILYVIYLVLTLLETALLMLGGMNFFDALLHSFSTAGTGGFSNKNSNVSFFNSAYIDIVISIFMLLFSLNFNLYFLLLLKRFRLAFRNEELLWYLGVVAFATLSIALCILPLYNNNFASSLRYSFFQVSSIISTTGFYTADFGLWPQYAGSLLVLLMLVGACAGSTGGGIKMSRILIVFKSIRQELRRLLHPRSVHSVVLNEKPVDRATINCTHIFLLLYFFISFLAMLLISLDNWDFTTNLTAVFTCMSNVGPGLSKVGPIFNFAFFSDPAKLLLSLCMLLGRLEFYPILMLLPSLRRR